LTLKDILVATFHVNLVSWFAVLGKIIYKMISNQKQNHALKIDLKSKSSFCKRFEIIIIFHMI